MLRRRCRRSHWWTVWEVRRGWASERRNLSSGREATPWSLRRREFERISSFSPSSRRVFNGCLLCVYYLIGLTRRRSLFPVPSSYLSSLLSMLLVLLSCGFVNSSASLLYYYSLDGVLCPKNVCHSCIFYLPFVFSFIFAIPHYLLPHFTFLFPCHFISFVNCPKCSSVFVANPKYHFFLFLSHPLAILYIYPRIRTTKCNPFSVTFILRASFAFTIPHTPFIEYPHTGCLCITTYYHSLSSEMKEINKQKKKKKKKKYI